MCIRDRQHIATTNASTYTFSSTSTGGANDIGATASDRMVICGAGISATATATRNISTTAIGGVTTATSLQLRHQRSATVGSTFNTYAQHIVTALISTATTANVVVTATTTVGNCSINVWSATHVGASFATYGTFTTATVGWATATGGSSMTTTVGSAGFYVARAMGSVSVLGVTWTGATEDHDTYVEGSSVFHSGANGATGGTVTVAASATTNIIYGAIWAAFGDNSPVSSAALYRTFLPLHSAAVGRRPLMAWSAER